MKNYNGFKKTIGWLLRLIWRIEVIGEENQPQTGGYLLCCNHTSMADVIPMAIGTKRTITFMAKAEALRVPVVGSFLKALGAFPVKRGAADVKALRTAMQILQDGGVVGFFPQGTRHPGEDPRQTKVLGGAGMMAYHTKCAVVPMCLKTKANRVKPFCKTQVIYGKPLSYEELGFEKGGGAEFQRASELIFDRICSLNEGGADAPRRET